jgi:hypothetical protein
LLPELSFLKLAAYLFAKERCFYGRGEGVDQ